MNFLNLMIISSTLLSMFYYWSTARNKWLKSAYISAILNGFTLTYVNYQLALGKGDWSVNIFTILCIWLIIFGLRGLKRLKEKQQHPRDTFSELLGEKPISHSKLSGALLELFENNLTDCIRWLDTSNVGFNGLTPLDKIQEDGNTRVVLLMVNQLINGVIV